MSSNDEYLKKKQAEIRGSNPKVEKTDKVELSVQVTNALLDQQERMLKVMNQLNTEIKQMRQQKGQQSLD